MPYQVGDIVLAADNSNVEESHRGRLGIVVCAGWGNISYYQVKFYGCICEKELGASQCGWWDEQNLRPGQELVLKNGSKPQEASDRWRNLALQTDPSTS